jgi:hypothetical protein
MNVLIAITRQLAQKTGGKINRALDWSPKRGVLPGDISGRCLDKDGALVKKPQRKG